MSATGSSLSFPTGILDFSTLQNDIVSSLLRSSQQKTQTRRVYTHDINRAIDQILRNPLNHPALHRWMRWAFATHSGDDGARHESTLDTFHLRVFFRFWKQVGSNEPSAESIAAAFDIIEDARKERGLGTLEELNSPFVSPRNRRTSSEGTSGTAVEAAVVAKPESRGLKRSEPPKSCGERPPKRVKSIPTPTTTPITAASSVTTSSMPAVSLKTLKRAAQSSSRIPSDRPSLPTHPPLWAESRQDVCETLPWFRSYQGGVYHSNRIAKGYLLSKHGSARDGWFHDGRLIISHGGGKGANLARLASGKYISKTATDQLESDLSVRALLNTYNERLPMVLLIDDRYPHFPYDLENSRRTDGGSGYTYVVLGFYFIKDAWVELEPSDSKDGAAVMRYKFAFQWCDGQPCPWWLSKGTSQETSRKQTRRTRRKKNPIALSQMLLKTCSDCKCAAPQVYSHAWVCLNKTCSMFFKVRTTTAPSLSALTYNPTFLALSKDPVVLDANTSLEPGPPVIKDDVDLVFGTEAAFTRGWHCTKCGRMSSRSVWRCWTCSSCGNEFQMSMEIQRAEDLSKRQRSKKVKPVVITDTRIGEENSQTKTKNGLMNRQTFQLPNGAGKIHRISYLDSTKRADRIFKRYQTEAQNGSLDFKRWPLRAHRCRGQLLTNYFSHNCGEPYHYVGGTENTVSWQKAPKAVRQAREYLTETAQVACAKELGANLEFNEVLSAAYMEDQSMAFHSDAETGLGPVVAGLSLGSSARMTFRMRRSALKLLEPRGVCKSRQRSQSSRPHVLSFTINHGDVCIMEGAGIQDFYEHTVQPYGFRIAATARRIN